MKTCLGYLTKLNKSSKKTLYSVIQFYIQQRKEVCQNSKVAILSGDFIDAIYLLLYSFMNCVRLSEDLQTQVFLSSCTN